MNIQQLEYIVAVEQYKQFAKAAEHCFVTQPTLSMMIQKFEDEIGLKIFDRSKQPITVTKEGEEIIQRAKKILSELKQLKEYTKEVKGDVHGELKIGIIPTLAPYLLPLFIKSFSEAYPELRLVIRELMTSDMIDQLKNSDIDVAILAGPINERDLTELALFKEPFYVYGSLTSVLKKNYIAPHQLKAEQLWLLEEGHCFRNQVMNFCELRVSDQNDHAISYEAGSIETLINLVDKYEGITIVPHLAITHLKKNQTAKVHEFANPKPCRQISMVVQKNYPRLKAIHALKEFITELVPLQNEVKGLKAISIN
jgi:LysR family hydrogen peroxide-inducible transcriptional activator